MVNLEDNKCCSCHACGEICPKNAITFVCDKYGFKYPRIDIDACIQCGVCNSVCQEEFALNLNKPFSILAAVANDKTESFTSSSAGISTIISKAIINRGGVVYGSSMISYKEIRHIKIENSSELELLKGSKYVQSDLDGVFKNVRNDLINQREVLFIGLPCQVAGLRSFLKKDYPNLYTVDLICHGVPSIKFLESYVNENFSNPKPDLKIRFRWKVSSKHDPVRFGIQFVNGQDEIIKTISAYRSSYLAAFFSGISYRENCHRCTYSCIERVSDLTLGDFWGLGNNIETSMDITSGVSLVLVNTANGKRLLESCKEHITTETHTIEECIAYNSNLKNPTPRQHYKDAFFDCWLNHGMEYAVEKYVYGYTRGKNIVYRLYLNLAISLSKISWINKIRLLMNNLFTIRS